MSLEPGSSAKADQSSFSFISNRYIWIPYLPLATGHRDIDKAAGVQHPLASAALGQLLLLLRLDLRGLRLDFAGTGERTVNFTHVCVLLFRERWVFDKRVL